MRSRILEVSLAICLALMSLTAGAQTAIPSTAVSFMKGATSATIRDKLQGPNADTHDYVVRAGSGQKMMVELETTSASTYFNVLPPGSDEALYRGEVSGEPKWSGPLPANGDYRVRVFLNRAAARQGKSAAFLLKISVTN